MFGIIFFKAAINAFLPFLSCPCQTNPSLFSLS